MGIDLARICNHNLHFNNQVQFVNNLSKAFNCNVVPHYTNDENLIGADGAMYLDEVDDKTVQDVIDDKDIVSMHVTNSKTPNEYDLFYINPFVAEFSQDEYYIGRWNTVKHIADELKENGFPNKAFYETNKDDYWFLNRKKYYDFIKTIGGTQSVIFCDDKHQEWLDYFADNYTIDDYIEWGKKELIFVEFKDLIDFDFPEKKPDYHNVFILDNFEDLKAFEYKTVQ